jgi:Zn-dependent peptidase ImmA (M78 family)
MKSVSKSRNSITELARDLRKRLGVDDQHAPDLKQVLAELPKIAPQFQLEVGDTRIPHVDAIVNFRTKKLYVKPDVLEGLNRGDKRARFTIAHELGHIALSHEATRFRKKPGAHIDLRDRHREREASIFAIEFLLPRHLVQKYRTVRDIASDFQVTPAVAAQRAHELGLNEVAKSPDRPTHVAAAASTETRVPATPDRPIESTSELTYIAPMRTQPPEAHSLDDARRIHNALHLVLEQESFPYGMRQFDLEFGQDVVGDPAVWISFPIEDDPYPSMEKLSNLNRFVHRVQDVVRENTEGRWPYVRFRAAH